MYRINQHWPGGNDLGNRPATQTFFESDTSGRPFHPRKAATIAAEPSNVLGCVRGREAKSLVLGVLFP